MPSFDIVSETDLAEVDNAIGNMMREIGTRYDFKGSSSTAEHADGVITLNADDELKLKQMQELLRGHLARRSIDHGVLDFQEPERAAGQSMRQSVRVKQGIEKDLAKKLVKDIKGTKLKVQVAIQGEELRVTGKNRDDLQEVIQFVKSLPYEQPFQYTNFRD